MSGPRLSPPCPGWQADLPEPWTPPSVAASLGQTTPNHIDNVYLEIARPTGKKGILIWFALPAGLSPFYVGSYVISECDPLSVFNIMVLGAFFLPTVVWSVFYFIRTEVSIPSDEPIRFNRSRQRIYAYNFKYRWWNPFERWYVLPVAYDWSQVRAERWKKRGTTAQGAVIFKWGVVLSIVEPGTNKVIDRFPLSTMGADEFAWAYVCTYMQQGPSVLPPPGPPRDHNDVPWYNLALRLAPKVKWPADMDLESRTAQ